MTDRIEGRDLEINVLIIGATGFVGCHLVKRLNTAGEHVKTFVRPSTDVIWLDAVGVEVRL